MVIGPLSMEDRHNSGVGQGLYDAHDSSKDAGVLFEPKTGKDVPPPGGKPGTGCVGSLTLGEGAFQAQDPFLYREIRAESLQAPDCLSQQ